MSNLNTNDIACYIPSAMLLLDDVDVLRSAKLSSAIVTNGVIPAAHPSPAMHLTSVHTMAQPSNITAGSSYQGTQYKASQPNSILDASIVSSKTNRGDMSTTTELDLSWRTQG